MAAGVVCKGGADDGGERQRIIRLSRACADVIIQILTGSADTALLLPAGSGNTLRRTLGLGQAEVEKGKQSRARRLLGIASQKPYKSRNAGPSTWTSQSARAILLNQHFLSRTF